MQNKHYGKCGVNNMQIKKRALSLIVAVCLIIALLPAASLKVYAAGVISSESIEAAISYAKQEKQTRPAYWRGYCAAFVWACYNKGAKIGNSSYATAREMGDALISNTDGNPPRGALVFWYKTSDYSAAGHVALSLGDGQVIHAFSNLMETSISYVNNCGYTYRGWGAPIAGMTLETANVTVPEPELNNRGYNMTVNVGAGSTLRFCSSWSSTSARLGSIPNGSSVYVYGVTVNEYDSRYWAKISWNGQDGWVNYAWLKDVPPQQYDTPDVWFTYNSAELDLSGNNVCYIPYGYSGDTELGYYLTMQRSGDDCIEAAWAENERIRVRGVAAGQAVLSLSIIEYETGRVLDTAKCTITVTGPIKYGIVVGNSRHGTVTADRETANAGDTVTLTVSPEQDWVLDTLAVTSESGEEIDLYIVEAGEKYTFEMPDSGVTVTAIFMENNTIPINASEWALPWVELAYELGLVPDCLDGADLTRQITRREFAAVAVKIYEFLTDEQAMPVYANPFIDCSDEEVLKAYNIGITNGTAADRFSPNQVLNREQLATMLTRVYKRTAISGWTLADDAYFNAQFKAMFTMPTAFADDSSISAYAKDSVYFMKAQGIIDGVGNNMFAPRHGTTANEAANYGLATREQALKIAVGMVINLK